MLSLLVFCPWAKHSLNTISFNPGKLQKGPFPKCLAMLGGHAVLGIKLSQRHVCMYQDCLTFYSGLADKKSEAQKGLEGTLAQITQLAYGKAEPRTSPQCPSPKPLLVITVSSRNNRACQVVGEECEITCTVLSIPGECSVIGLGVKLCWCKRERKRECER